MKNRLLTAYLFLGMMTGARATIYYQGLDVTGNFNEGLLAMGNSTIEDGNPAYVISDSMTLSGLGTSLSDIAVTLSVSGGMNNGFYAYLVGPNGTTVTLLNQPGVTSGNPFGNTGSGLNITLADGGTAISADSNLSSGTYAAAGSLSGFSSSDPNGTWTLYFADTIAGGGDAMLNGWSLNLSTAAVPEPTTSALIVFGCFFGLVGAVRWCWCFNQAPR